MQAFTKKNVLLGILVQHTDACRSVLHFLAEIADVESRQAFVQHILIPRGLLLTQYVLRLALWFNFGV